MYYSSGASTPQWGYSYGPSQPEHHHRHHHHRHRSHSPRPVEYLDSTGSYLQPTYLQPTFQQPTFQQPHHHRRHSNPPPPDRGLIYAQPQTVQPVMLSPSHHHHRHHHHSQDPMPMFAPPASPYYQQDFSRAVQSDYGATNYPMDYNRPVSAHQHPAFQYSRCTGRKKALCIGINYIGQGHQLNGCINDALNMRHFLIHQWGYDPDDVLLLTDDSKNYRSIPTRSNMIDAMNWLVDNAQPHDALFFHYSGHGGRTPDLDGDEMDGYDDVIYPVDYLQSGHITDDDLHNIMVKPLPPGCRLTAIFDSCHSGTVLDLAFVYDHHGQPTYNGIQPAALPSKVSPADVISWSGCRDDQQSVDTFQNGESVGAMSYAFVQSLTNNPAQTYLELLLSVRAILHPNFSQIPQLGSSHYIDTSLRFII